jgi:hypothetical protein
MEDDKCFSTHVSYFPKIFEMNKDYYDSCSWVYKGWKMIHFYVIFKDQIV